MSVFDWFNKSEQGPASAQPQAISAEELEERVITALRTVFDPEIPVNIYDLGLIYGITVDAPTGKVHVDMTLTAPGCPVAQTFPDTVKNAVEMADGVTEATVELVWEPPWTRDRMSEAVQLELGML